MRVIDSLMEHPKLPAPQGIHNLKLWHLFAGAALTKYHRLGDLSSRDFLPEVLEAKSLRSKRQQGCFF